MRERQEAISEKKSRDDIAAIESFAWFEESMIDEEIAILVTDYLVTEARQNFVPIPSREDKECWEQCQRISERHVLSSTGISKLRSVLRAEAKEKKELFLKVLAAVTGVLGAITGLVAVLNN